MWALIFSWCRHGNTKSDQCLVTFSSHLALHLLFRYSSCSHSDKTAQLDFKKAAQVTEIHLVMIKPFINYKFLSLQFIEIYESQVTLLYDLEIARCLTLQFINRMKMSDLGFTKRKCAIYKSQLCVLCISNAGANNVLHYSVILHDKQYFLTFVQGSR